MLQLVSLTAGCWLIMSALWITTENVQSAMVFKIIPFFLGLGTVLGSLKALSWV